MIAPGFADPGMDSQACFRALLTAMSYPGRIVALPSPTGMPSGLPPAMAALVLALCDEQTPLWQDAGDDAAAWIAFHTGAPAASLEAARFVMVTAALPSLGALCAGTDEEPQDGATLLLQVAALSEGAGWVLQGPGIKDAARLRVDGAPDGFVAARAALAPIFPRGIDIVLCAGDRIAALPRTTRIAESG